MIIDMHNHFVPVDSLKAVDETVRVIEGADGAFELVDAKGHHFPLNPGLVDLDIQCEVMAKQRVERRTLSIPPFCFQYELPADRGAKWARAVNEGIAEAARERSDAFIGFATLPLQDVASALVELDYATGQLGLAGLEIASNINGVELDAPTLDPLWERLSDLAIPVLIHPHYVAGANRMGGYHLRNLIGNPTDTALAGARLIFSGVLDRFPGLRIILSHGGGSLPGLIGRLEQGRRVRSEIATEGPFDAQLRTLYYDTIVFDHRPLQWLVETAGANRVVLGTDYPFDMGDEDPVGFVESSPLSDSSKHTILASGERLLTR